QLRHQLLLRVEQRRQVVADPACAGLELARVGLDFRVDVVAVARQRAAQRLAGRAQAEAGTLHADIGAGRGDVDDAVAVLQQQLALGGVDGDRATLDDQVTLRGDFRLAVPVDGLQGDVLGFQLCPDLGGNLAEGAVHRPVGGRGALRVVRIRRVAAAPGGECKAGEQGDGMALRGRLPLASVVRSALARQVDAAGAAVVAHVAAAGRAHGQVATGAIDFDVAGADRADRDAAADVLQVEVAGADRADLDRSAGGSDRDVARADAADLRGAADVADDRVAGANRGQVERTDVAGLQVARAQRRGQFATDAVGLGVARPGIDARTACTSDSGIAGTD